MLNRRELLHSAFAVGGLASLGIAWPASPNLALTLAQFLNRTQFRDLPSKAVDHAKMIIASTLASAAPGSLIDSARIVRELAKERGGKPEATVWFDGTRLPVAEAARHRVERRRCQLPRALARLQAAHKAHRGNLECDPCVRPDEKRLRFNVPARVNFRGIPL